MDPSNKLLVPMFLRIKFPENNLARFSFYIDPKTIISDVHKYLEQGVTNSFYKEPDEK